VRLEPPPEQFERLLGLWSERWAQTEPVLYALGLNWQALRADEIARSTPTTPFESVTRAATVGFPRESRISYPRRPSILSGISFPNVSNGIGRIEDQVPGKGADAVFQSRVRDIFRRRFTVDSRQEQGAEVHALPVGGGSRLSRQAHLVMWGDYLSFYLAQLRGVDPTPVASIDEFKRRMAAAATTKEN